jgi:hypothetical protein
MGSSYKVVRMKYFVCLEMCRRSYAAISEKLGIRLKICVAQQHCALYRGVVYE